jgi:hypothetical protein
MKRKGRVIEDMEEVRLWNAIRRGIQVFPCKGLTVGSHAPVTCPYYEPHATRVPIQWKKRQCAPSDSGLRLLQAMRLREDINVTAYREHQGS